MRSKTIKYCLKYFIVVQMPPKKNSKTKIPKKNYT